MVEFKDTIVMDPEHLESLVEIEEVMRKISLYERERDCRAGVVLIQNMQLGGLYKIISEKEADVGLTKPMVAEWYVQFYPKTYFEALKGIFETGKQPDYRNLDKKYAVTREQLRAA